jgi:hypothetical protein
MPLGFRLSPKNRASGSHSSGGRRADSRCTFATTSSSIYGASSCPAEVSIMRFVGPCVLSSSWGVYKSEHLSCKATCIGAG